MTVQKNLILVMIAVGLLFAVICYVYKILKANFWRRGMETSGFLNYFTQKYPGLSVSRFMCQRGRKKLGGLLIKPQNPPLGLIVMTHGYGRTLEHYLPEARQFAGAGFAVLLFDGTGFGMSGGRWMRGLPQHVLDMRQILEYVQQDGELSAYPLFLYGHSWGGYAADTVGCLGHFPIKGLISVSAYNDALAVVRHVSRRRYGRLAPLVIMLFKIYQVLFFGKISCMTSAQGLQKLSCPMLICHSLDDTVVSFHENFGNIRAALSERKNVIFWEMDGRNHNLTTPRDIDMRQRALIHQLKEKYAREKEQELWQLQTVIDEELLDKFVLFYRACLDEGFSFKRGSGK